MGPTLEAEAHFTTRRLHVSEVSFPRPRLWATTHTLWVPFAAGTVASNPWFGPSPGNQTCWSGRGRSAATAVPAEPTNTATKVGDTDSSSTAQPLTLTRPGSVASS